mmetsp:Transcript_16738/g.39745  ORF Transcript_16738/g.39745 Transcript_16738/m.39745 type:complete len:271 (-) Transcript_16738:195-1007(-)
MVVAVLLSMIVTHLMLAAHRTSVYPGTKNHEAHTRPKALHRKLFHFRGELIRLAGWQRYGILFLLVASAALILYGASIECITLTYDGAAGYMLEAQKEPHIKRMSMWQITNPTDHPPIVSQVVLKTVLLAGLIFPLIDMGMLVILWVAPLTLKAAHRLHLASEVVGAWSSLDVLVVTLFAVRLEMRQFIAFIFKDKCAFLSPVLKDFFDSLLNGHDVCFEVWPGLGPGVWYLFVATITSLFARSIIDRCSYQARHPNATPHTTLSRWLTH